MFTSRRYSLTNGRPHGLLALSCIKGNLGPHSPRMVSVVDPRSCAFLGDEQSHQSLGTSDTLSDRRSTKLSTHVSLAVSGLNKYHSLGGDFREEYQGLLTYYLPDRSLAWSNMFGIMERAKRDINVEDYSISQTTLEQIFLQFTKYQQESILNNK
ncbi:hypothetical protein evm_001040 [Chilo suppressalis]|nr:hypothetical protein evm_001040 [Chilo suppressalis]